MSKNITITRRLVTNIDDIIYNNNIITVGVGTTAGGGGGTEPTPVAWGNISGNLEDQTDVSTAIDTKLPKTANIQDLANVVSAANPGTQFAIFGWNNVGQKWDDKLIQAGNGLSVFADLSTVTYSLDASFNDLTDVSANSGWGAGRFAAYNDLTGYLQSTSIIAGTGISVDYDNGTNTIAVTNTATNPWVGTGGNIYYEGNVMIGHAGTPEATLSVRGENTSEDVSIYLQPNIGTVEINSITTASQHDIFKVRENGSGYALIDTSTGHMQFTLTDSTGAKGLFLTGHGTNEDNFISGDLKVGTLENYGKKLSINGGAHMVDAGAQLELEGNYPSLTGEDTSNNSKWYLGVQNGGSDMLIQSVASTVPIVMDTNAAFVRLNEYLQIAEVSEPATPASGFGSLFSQAGGGLYWKNDAGTVIDIVSGSASAIWGSITGNLEDQTDVSTAIDLARQWELSGNDIYNGNSGNVGIGTSSPANILHVDSGATDITMRMESDNSQLVFTGTSTDFRIVSRNAADSDYHNFGIKTISGSDPNFLIDTNGNVGIGTIDPSVLLHVYKNTDGAQLARFEGDGSDYVDIRDYGIEVNRSAAYFRNSRADSNIHIQTHNGTSQYDRIFIDGANNQTLFHDHNGQALIEFNSVSSDPYIRFKDSAGANSTVLYEDPTALGGTYGSLMIDGGGTGSYEGLSIGGRVVFMHDNATDSGIFNDVDNHWMFRGTLGAETRMYYAASEKIRTTNTGATITGDADISGQLLSTSIGALNDVSTATGFAPGAFLGWNDSLSLLRPTSLIAGTGMQVDYNNSTNTLTVTNTATSPWTGVGGYTYFDGNVMIGHTGVPEATLSVRGENTSEDVSIYLQPNTGIVEINSITTASQHEILKIKENGSGYALIDTSNGHMQFTLTDSTGALGLFLTGHGTNEDNFISGDINIGGFTNYGKKLNVTGGAHFQDAGSQLELEGNYPSLTGEDNSNNSKWYLGVAQGGSDIQLTAVATSVPIVLNTNAAYVQIEEYLRLKEVAAPGTPSSGYGSLYPKTDGILYFKNDAGTETPLGGGGTDKMDLDVNTRSISANTTLTSSDRGKTIECTNTITVTFPTGIAVPNMQCVIVNVGTGTVTIAPGAANTINSKGGFLDLATQYGASTVYNRNATQWVAFGDLS